MRYMIIAAVLLLIVITGCAPSEEPTEVPAEEQGAEEQGRAVFTITDAAADMSSVTSIQVTVDSVEAHSTTEGWVQVSSTPQTYDLLALKAEGKEVLLADVQLNEGTYEQVRLNISKVVVVDADGEHEATLPSSELKIVGTFDVAANTTSVVKFDFIADESLHVTGNGEYILAPVVDLETKEDAMAEVGSDNSVEVEGGSVRTKVKVGMDADGNVGEGLALGKDIALEISNGKVKLGLTMSEEAKANASMESEAEAEAEASAEAGAEVEVGY